MGVGKVLVGIGIGVGAVAAAPFTGGGSILGAASLVGSLAGASTVAAAVGAGAVGGAIASASEKKKKSDIQSAEKKGYQKGKAENAIEIQRMKSMIEDARKKLDDSIKFERFILSITAVAFSVAFCDGSFSTEEEEEIEEYIAGIARYGFSDKLKKDIQQLKDNPPSFNTAMEFVKDIDKSLWKVFDDVITLTVHSDGVIHPNEEAYIEAWKEYKAS